MKTEAYKYTVKVHKGAEFLDEARPDWIDHINTGTLRLESSNDCVLGQLGRSVADGDCTSHFSTIIFSDGCRYPALGPIEGMGLKRALKLGFTASQAEGFHFLNEAWRGEIAQRSGKANTWYLHVTAVHRGAKWLDKHMEGWAARLDLETLDLNDARVCVLGQLGNYLHEGADYDAVVRFEDGCEFPELAPLAIVRGKTYNLGFNSRIGGWGILNEAWRGEILLRR